MKPPTSLLLLLVLILVFVAFHCADCRLNCRHLSAAYQSEKLTGSKNFISVQAVQTMLFLEDQIFFTTEDIHFSFDLRYREYCCSVWIEVLYLATCPIILYYNLQFDSKWNWCFFFCLSAPFFRMFLDNYQFTCQTISLLFIYNAATEHQKLF